MLKFNYGIANESAAQLLSTKIVGTSYPVHDDGAYSLMLFFVEEITTGFPLSGCNTTTVNRFIALFV